MKLLIYTLTCLAALLLVLGCARSCYVRSDLYRRRHPPQDGQQQQQQQQQQHGRSSLVEYLSNSLPRRRPLNAPPTYEDATKNDNVAFEPDDNNGAGGGSSGPPTYDESGPMPTCASEPRFRTEEDAVVVVAGEHPPPYASRNPTPILAVRRQGQNDRENENVNEIRALEDSDEEQQDEDQGDQRNGDKEGGS